MQLIWRCDLLVEDYVATEAQNAAIRPEICPHCGRSSCLRALGYYSRSISSNTSGRILVARVRRFRCRLLGKTVSLLPSFAHPYRLVGSSSIDRYFSGRRSGIEMVLRSSLLKRYWRRFEIWLPYLLVSTGGALGRPRGRSSLLTLNGHLTAISSDPGSGTGWPRRGARA
jgi:hypothetical protein